MGRGETHRELHEAAGRDLGRLFGELERQLESDFFCGSFSIADIAVLPHLMAATFLGYPIDPATYPRLAAWVDRVQVRPTIMRDNMDVMETLQRLQAERKPAFDPFRVQWRSDRLEWVIKNGFFDWFADELRAGRAFFPVPIR
jgi:glutathione S-transferase